MDGHLRRCAVHRDHGGLLLDRELGLPIGALLAGALARLAALLCRAQLAKGLLALALVILRLELARLLQVHRPRRSAALLELLHEPIAGLLPLLGLLLRQRLRWSLREGCGDECRRAEQRRETECSHDITIVEG
jgi:hypothetical protein